MARIFISYCRADQHFVEEIAPLLERSYTVWYDRDIPGGRDWWQTILDQIHQCDLFLYLVSNDSLTSSYCQDEFREALLLNKSFLPVIVRPKTDYPGAVAPDLKSSLERTQFVPLENFSREAFADLFAAVKGLLDDTQPTPQHILSLQEADDQPVPDNRFGPPWTLLAAGVTVVAILAFIIVLALNGGGNEDEKSSSVGTESKVAAVTETAGPLPASTDLPTATPDIFVTETQVAFDQTATDQAIQDTQRGMEASQTAQSLETQAIQISTANAQAQTIQAEQDNSWATRIVQATETQAAFDQIATANAQVTGTQVALESMTAAASPPTMTPAPPPTNTPFSAPITRTPVFTQQPTLTFTPAPAPNLRMIFDGERFVLINIGSETLNVADLVFEQYLSDGTRLAFAASAWDAVAYNKPSEMVSQICYQVVTYEGTLYDPSIDICPGRPQAWLRVVEHARYFWIAENPDAVFTVRRADDPTVLATCPIALGECSFYLR